MGPFSSCYWLCDFDRLRKLKVKFNYKNFRALRINLLINMSSYEYHEYMIDAVLKRHAKTHITGMLTPSFIEFLE